VSITDSEKELRARLAEVLAAASGDPVVARALADSFVSEIIRDVDEWKAIVESASAK
jgi:hypothetical protein